MSITDSELEKYRVYLEEGTMQATADKLNLTTGAVQKAISNVNDKVLAATKVIQIGIELEAPFKKIKQEYLMERLDLALDETKEIIAIDKVMVEDFKKILKQEGLPDWQELVRQIIYEKWNGYKKKYPLIFKSE